MAAAPRTAARSTPASDPVPGPGPSVASRVLAILAVFDDAHRELTLSDIARRADLPTSTAHRLVGELAAWGALERRADGRYAIGDRLWQIGTLAGPRGLREIASPYLHDVYATTLATVHLAVRDGMEALYVARLAGHRSVPIISSEGGRTPLHSTAVGKVLLAYAPPEVLAQVLGNLTRKTTRTIAAPGPLLRQLEKVRADGFAESHEEMSVGADAVAVPVQGPHGVVAALGAAVDTTGRDLPRVTTALTIAARGISRSLGLSFRSPGKD